MPENDTAIVERILTLTGIEPATNIDYKDELISVYDLLRNKLNIVYLPERVVKQYASVVQQNIPSTRIDLYDLLKIYPAKNEKQFLEVLKILEPITPRLYSIASSPEAHPGEVHITVAKSYFSINEEIKFGLASDFLSKHPCFIPVLKFSLVKEVRNKMLVAKKKPVLTRCAGCISLSKEGAEGRNTRSRPDHDHIFVFTR